MHWSPYALILFAPLDGWLMSSAMNYPVSSFGLLTFPNLIAPDEDRFEQFHELHEALVVAISSLAILHILAVLKHHFIAKDNVPRHISPMKLR